MPLIQLSDQSSAGNRAHQTAIVAAEQTRQAVLTTATMNAAGALAMRNADIAYYRSLVASARTNGLDPGPYIQALQALGTGGT